MAIHIEFENKPLLIPEASDPCDLWISYFKQLKKLLGHSNAKMIWLITWKSNTPASCGTSPVFNKWLKKQKLDVSNIASQSIADLSEIGANLFGLGKQLSKVLAVGVPILLAVILITIIVVLRNTTKNADVTDLAALTPTGRISKLLS